jgi:oligopeptide/dipeptide ABC transporter ATP-binding protein
VGESGSGKTVTALSVVGLLPSMARVASGTVELDGRHLTGMSRRELRRVRGRRIGIVFQDSMTSLNPVVSVGIQITESLETHLGLGGRDARARALELLEEVGVPEPGERLKQFPHQLSGGLRQRVAVAMALAADPGVLIADEPTTALDVTIQAQLLELLKRRQAERQMALILITHDLGVVAGTCDRVAVMYAGRIVEEGPTEAVLTAPRHPYTLGLLRSVPRLDAEVLDRLPSIAGAPPAPGAIPDGCPFRPRCSFAFERCEIDPPLRPAGAEGQAAACWADLRGEPV